MIPDDVKTFYCKTWELKEFKKQLIKDNYKIISIEKVTSGKVVIVAKDILKNG